MGEHNYRGDHKGTQYDRLSQQQLDFFIIS